MKFLVILFSIISLNLFSQDMATRKKHYLTDKSVAISGFDPVSYFQGKPVEGKKEFSYNQEGVIYHFTSASNLENFKKSPSKYEPQYGGWCAYAMGSKGEKVTIDPETYKIVNGKLYLFYHTFFANTLPDWNKDEANLKVKADSNWEKIIKK